ncbi:hypothetical protein DFH09DRAFT_1333002 [Mycena vulgaris]|nr:hypothetical protein DFH09DRAFT_1333002 [Mycena vulgaris]
MLLSPTAIYIASRCAFRPSSVPSSLYSRQLLRSSSLPPPPSPPSPPQSTPSKGFFSVRLSLLAPPPLVAAFIRMAVGGGERRTVYCRPSRAYIVRQQSPPPWRFQLQWALGGNSDACRIHDDDARHAPVSLNAWDVRAWRRGGSVARPLPARFLGVVALSVFWYEVLRPTNALFVDLLYVLTI